MTSNAVEIEVKAAESNAEDDKVLQRFVVLVAGGKCPIISFSNFWRAERLALLFAGLVNTRIEVFDEVKGFVTSSNLRKRATCAFIKSRRVQRKNKSGKQKNVMNERKNGTRENAELTVFTMRHHSTKN